MRAKRWGRAGHGREQPRRKVIFLAVLAGLLVCLVLPVRAQKKTGKLCFPLDTTQYRVSDGYGWRQDPFTGERTFHKGIDLACAEGTEVIAAARRYSVVRVRLPAAIRARSRGAYHVARVYYFYFKLPPFQKVVCRQA